MSVRLSVCPIYRPLQQRAAGLLLGSVGRRYRSIAARLVLRINCGQCHVVSRRRKLNTDLFSVCICAADCRVQSHDTNTTSCIRLTQRRRQDFVTGRNEVWVYRGSRVRSPPVPVVLSVYQRGSLLDGLAMYLSCDTNKFHDNESTHILHNFWTSTHRGKLPLPPGGATGLT